MARISEEASSGVAAEVVIRGPGHHERAERARRVVAAISVLGIDVVVSTDLRPRLADDIRALLEAGAVRVRLEAEGIAGDLALSGRVTDSPDSGAGGSSPATVLVTLSAGSSSPPEVRGDGELADAVRAALDELGETPPADDYD